MARTRNPVPSYLHHKQSGRGRLVWTDAAGTRHFRLLPGPFGSAESLEAKARLELELAASPLRASADPGDISVAEVLLAYAQHAERHYRRADGTQTGEIHHVRVVCRHTRELYGETPATSFGPLALKSVRERFIRAGWCRKTVNQETERVRRIFKWAASEELVPASVYQALATVGGLQRGRTTAHEPEPVKPVDDAVVDATLPHLNRQVRAMVEFQRLTGCRPGEACVVRRRDIDMSARVWLYRPPHHKNAHRGKERVIAVGPRAQEVLQQFFTARLDDYLFSPRLAVEELRAIRSANRRTPRYPSHMRRNAAVRRQNPKCSLSDHYDVQAYGTAIDRACDAAFPPPPPLAKREEETLAEWKARLTEEQREELGVWRKAHRWCPNQLRHSHATRVRKEFGLEAAQVTLGHARADVTQVYAERDQALATMVAAQIG